MQPDHREDYEYHDPSCREEEPAPHEAGRAVIPPAVSPFFVPVLGPVPAVVAFHPLIRLAVAVVVYVIAYFRCSRVDVVILVIAVLLGIAAACHGIAEPISVTVRAGGGAVLIVHVGSPGAVVIYPIAVLWLGIQPSIASAACLQHGRLAIHVVNYIIAIVILLVAYLRRGLLGDVHALPPHTPRACGCS